MGRRPDRLRLPGLAAGDLEAIGAVGKAVHHVLLKLVTTIGAFTPPTCFQLWILPMKMSRSCPRLSEATGLVEFTKIASAS